MYIKLFNLCFYLICVYTYKKYIYIYKEYVNNFLRIYCIVCTLYNLIHAFAILRLYKVANSICLSVCLLFVRSNLAALCSQASILYIIII